MNKENIKKEQLQTKKDEIEQVNTQQYFSIPIEVLQRNSSQACICYMYLLYKSNLGNIVTNTSLAKDMDCSTRTITRLLDELAFNDCIKILYVNKAIRYIYPVYILPIIYKINNTDNEEQEEKKQIEEKPTKELIQELIEKYSKEKYNSKPLIEVDDIYNYYTANNWYMGKSKIKDIYSVVKLWIDKAVKENKNLINEKNDNMYGEFRTL